MCYKKCNRRFFLVNIVEGVLFSFNNNVGKTFYILATFNN